LACFHVFDGGIKVGLQLTQMTAKVPHHAIRRDCIPVGPLDLDGDKHLLIAVHLNGQIDAAPATPDEPPLTFPESRCLASPVRKADWTVLWKAWPAVSRSTRTRSSAQCSSSPVVHHLG